MRTHRAILPLLCAAAAALTLVRCSVSPTVADGGTHTGNPDISACASALFDIMETGDEWHVGHYVDSQALDPSYIDPSAGADPSEPYRTTLAKRAAVAETTVIDTILMYDTLFVNDTIIRQRVESDTVDTVFGGDTIMYINQWLALDTLIAVDTVVLVDTLVVIDTLPDRAVTLEQYDSVQFMIYEDAARNGTVPVPTGIDTSQFNVLPAASSDVLSRSGFYITPSGTQVFVEYRDADGDDLLFKAAQGTPRALLRQRRVAGALAVYLESEFSAGADLTFSSFADNTVLSLVRYRVSGGDTTETVVYAAPASGQAAADSAVLTINEYLPSDSVFSRKTRFSIAAAGTSPSTHSLAGITQTLLYRRGEVDKVVVVVVPQSLVGKGASPGVASFSAQIVSAENDTTSLQGTVDPQTGISGTYSGTWGTSTVSVALDGTIEVENQ